MVQCRASVIFDSSLRNYCVPFFCGGCSQQILSKKRFLILRDRCKHIQGGYMRLDIVGKIALILVIIGGINWGLVGLLNLDIIKLIFSTMPMAQKVSYIV